MNELLLVVKYVENSTFYIARAKLTKLTNSTPFERSGPALQ
jgi:hypothetical protein